MRNLPKKYKIMAFNIKSDIKRPSNMENVGVMWMLGYEVYPEGVFTEESWNKLRNWFGKLNLKFKESTQ